MLAAIFGLLGVLVGALANGIVSGALDRVREGRRAVVAARLVQDDLNYLHAVLSSEVGEGIWNRLTPGQSPLTFDSWPEGRDLLAEHLTFEEWAVVTVAARQAHLMMYRVPLNPHKPGDFMSTPEQENLETMVPDLWNGAKILTPLSRGDRAPGMWREMLPRRRTRSKPTKE
jgi:hypothetical protein